MVKQQEVVVKIFRLQVGIFLNAIWGK